MGKQHIIELNGKRYDAITGKMIDPQPAPKTPSTAQVPNLTKKRVDGFIIPSARTRSTKVTSSVVTKTQKSKTLMRATVKKPSLPNVMAGLTSLKTPQKVKLARTVSNEKLIHANKVPKHSLIHRFGVDTVIRSAKKTDQPPTKIANLQVSTIASVAQSDLLTRGLTSARGHEQSKPKKLGIGTRLATRFRVSPRVLNVLALSLSGLLIMGFFAYQNMPNLGMRLASSRSGVRGSLPDFQPAGFALDRKITYKPGQIVIYYRSNSDARNFKITQDNSAWNSETLADNFFGGADCSARCQIIQDKGKKVYLYEDSNATWVDGGVWYRIEGNSKLNSDQLRQIVSSL